MNGPLEENAKAETTASMSPDVLTRRTGSVEITGSEAVGAAMAEIRLSGVNCVYTGDTKASPCQESTWFSFVTPSSLSRLRYTS
jgi:hypothetical protein